MYVPSHFAEPRIEVLHELIRARPLATLVTHCAGALEANHVPLLLAAGDFAPSTTRPGCARRSNG